jgi:hypothetical protein
MPQLGTNADELLGGVEHRLISKSQYLQGRQCSKLLWLACNAHHFIPQPSARTEALFDQGREVGHLAQRLFPGGSEVGADITDLPQAVALTQEALDLRRPLFEAAFASRLACARCDILNPVGADGWDLYEVKSSTSAKPVYIHDLALQVRVMRDAGVNVRKQFVVYINTDFVRHGDLDPEQFFVREDVTDPVDDLLPAVGDNLDQMQKVIRLGDAPEVAIGEHCDNPRTCPLHDHCWSCLPVDNVFTLARIGAKAFKLLEQGISSVRDIPADFKLSPTQQLQRQAVVTGEPHLDKAAITTFLKRLEYPVHYLDFETFAPAIPIFEDDDPFEPIPFQFSLHVQPAPGVKPAHVMFLAAGTGDPRRAFMERLRAVLGDHGSVVVYNAHFEKGVLSRCAELFPEFGSWVGSVKHRVVDLLTPFKSFSYYHPDQRGSASIKQVMPAITGRGYDELDIQEGATASTEFVRVTFGDVSQAERQRVRRQLEVYCGRDSEGMVWIVEALRKLVSARHLTKTPSGW